LSHRRRKYEKKRLRKSDIVLGRKGLISIHASLKEGGDEKNTLTHGGIAHHGRHSLRNGNSSEVDRRLGRLQRTA
jgi:hypothetical protein